MGQIAASWGQGKIDVRAVRRETTVKAAQASRSRRWVECHECQQSGPHGGFGLCEKCYKQFRAANLLGKCFRCKRKDQHLRRVDPPLCLSCHAKERRRLDREADEAAVKAKQNQYARKQRQRPERRARDSEITKEYYLRHPEAYARKLARQKERYQERKAGLPAPPRTFVRHPKPAPVEAPRARYT